MPKIETTIEMSELLGYAEDEGIATWNEACDLIRGLYPEDGEGSTFIDPTDYDVGGEYEDEDPKVSEIIVGFAKKYEEEYKTYSNGFRAIVE